jgi:hypothetical protein
MYLQKVISKKNFVVVASCRPKEQDPELNPDPLVKMSRIQNTVYNYAEKWGTRENCVQLPVVIMWKRVLKRAVVLLPQRDVGGRWTLRLQHRHLRHRRIASSNPDRAAGLCIRITSLADSGSLFLLLMQIRIRFKQTFHLNASLLCKLHFEPPWLHF